MRITARVVAVVAALALGAYAWTVPSNLEAISTASAAGPDSPWVGDTAMYADFVEALRGGTPYYEALGEHLRRGHYPRLPVFNWRMPLWYPLLAQFPAGAERVLTSGALLLAVIFAWLPHPRKEALAVPATLAGLVLFLITSGELLSLFMETPAAVAIFASILLYARGNNRFGAAFGVLSVFLREIAAVYVLVASLRAVWRRDRGEFAVWAVGGLAFAAWYARHYAQVQAHLIPSDFAVEKRNWLDGGGIDFMIQCVEPHLVGLLWWGGGSALFIGMVVLGFAARRPEAALIQTTVVAYALGFALAGFSFNVYWGILWLAPLTWLAFLGVEVLGELTTPAFERARGWLRRS